MKVNRKLKGVPGGNSLSISLLYGLGDIKSALIQIKKRMGCGESTNFMELTQMLYDTATDPHMPREARNYIAEWMARIAISEGYVFRVDDYLGYASDKTDVYLIDEESVKRKMRGRKPKVEL